MHRYLSGLMLLSSIYLFWIQFNLLKFKTHRLNFFESQTEKIDEFNRDLKSIINHQVNQVNQVNHQANQADDSLCWFAIKQQDQPLIYFKKIDQDQKFHQWLKTQNCLAIIREGDLFEFGIDCHFQLKRIAVLDQIALKIPVAINELTLNDFKQLPLFKDQAHILEKIIPIHKIEDLEHLPKIGPSNLQILKSQFSVHPRKICFQSQK